MNFKFRSNKNEVMKKITESNIAGLTAVGHFLVSETKVRAPVDTGNYRDSIAFETNESDLSVTYGTDVDYAIWLEKGTSKAEAQPSITPAAEENASRIKGLFASVVRL